jgi:hypothetical protein
MASRPELGELCDLPEDDRGDASRSQRCRRCYIENCGKARGAGEIARSAVLTGILAHNSEMYGIATVYLRAKDLVPPSSKRAMGRPLRPEPA